MKCACLLLKTAFIAALWLSGGIAMAEGSGCNPNPFSVTMATPVSSRINWKGDPIQAVLISPLALSTVTVLPAGTLLKGKVADVKAYTPKQPGGLRLTFNMAVPLSGPMPIAAELVTPDGWLRQTERNTPVWQLNPNHSTRLLNEKIQRRLGADRTVWASVLGINENVIPNPTSDAFMIRYNKNDVLVGAGDRIGLRLICP